MKKKLEETLETLENWKEKREKLKEAKEKFPKKKKKSDVPAYIKSERMILRNPDIKKPHLRDYHLNNGSKEKIFHLTGDYCLYRMEYNPKAFETLPNAYRFGMGVELYCASKIPQDDVINVDKEQGPFSERVVINKGDTTIIAYINTRDKYMYFSHRIDDKEGEKLVNGLIDLLENNKPSNGLILKIS